MSSNPPPSIFQSPPDTPPPKRSLLVALLAIIGLIAILLVQLVRPLMQGSTSPGSRTTPPVFPTQKVTPMPATSPTQPSAPFLSHFIGGFSIESNAEIANASIDGIQTTLIYGYTPRETNDSVGEALKAYNMKAIDSIPWQDLYYFECHMNKTCPATTFPELTSPQAVLSTIAAHLKQVQNNPLVVGYWVLDDWAYQPGSAQSLLIQINNLIHHYTPGKPSICGFGGEIPPLPQTTYIWDDGTAANFSPQGCDMVGLYIYGQDYTSGKYDWTMSRILPAVFNSLKKRGWDMRKEPLVGIPQAFGGTVYGDSWPIPDTNSIETQTKTYCQLGATGIIFYEWGESEQSPMTNAQITQGIKNGIADCKAIWK